LNTGLREIGTVQEADKRALRKGLFSQFPRVDDFPKYGRSSWKTRRARNGKVPAYGRRRLYGDDGTVWDDILKRSIRTFWRA